MVPLKSNTTSKNEYIFTGNIGDHIHTYTDDKGESHSGMLEPGDKIEMTGAQYLAFKDRFRPVGEDEKEKNQPVAEAPNLPVDMSKNGGNMIREHEVIVDATAGPQAFKGAGQITAEAAALVKPAKMGKEPSGS